MSKQEEVIEPTDSGQGELTSEQEQVVEEIKGHPAWEEILNELPEDFQHAIKPKLQEWDKGVQKKIQDLHTTYDPYKNLIENGVPYEAIDQALSIMRALEEDPAGLTAKMIEQFNLDFISKDEVEEIDDDDDDNDDDDVVDITKHPQFKEIQNTVKKLQSDVELRTKAEEQTKAEKQFEETMKKLHEDFGEFSEEVVTAFMTTGMDGAKAVKQYQDTINQAAAKIAGSGNNTQQEIPVVMGGSGTSGSGLPENPVKMGQLTKNQTVDLVMDMLSKDGA